jgi:nickel/cobalt transporter (NicO) family protein
VRQKPRRLDMPPIAELIQQGATNLWVFIPTAILLGALHGLEPGHSKTMMASFIIAVKGTMAQAALLGLCALAFAHCLGIGCCRLEIRQ